MPYQDKELIRLTTAIFRAKGKGDKTRFDELWAERVERTNSNKRHKQSKVQQTEANPDSVAQQTPNQVQVPAPSLPNVQHAPTTIVGSNEWDHFSPTAPLSERLRAEINGRRASEETIKELLNANHARAQTAEQQLAKIECRSAVPPHVRDAILRRVFYSGGAIMRQCDGIWGVGCSFNSSISIFAGNIIVRIDDVRSIVCEKCVDTNDTQIIQFMQYNVSFERCKTFLLRSGLNTIGKCDVCDAPGVTAASTWERAHDIPKSGLGSKLPGNLFISHEGCNFLQNVMPIDVFRAKLGLSPVNRGIRIAYGATPSDVRNIISEMKDSEKTATEVLKKARRLFI